MILRALLPLGAFLCLELACFLASTFIYVHGVFVNILQTPQGGLIFVFLISKYPMDVAPNL